MPESPHKRTSRFDFTLDEIRTWGGDRQFVEALEQYANKGDVLNPRFENGIGEAAAELSRAVAGFTGTEREMSTSAMRSSRSFRTMATST